MKLATRCLFLVFACLLLGQLGTAQSVPQFSPFTADMQISTTRGGGAARDMTGKLYTGSGHLRLNMSAEGHESAIITDFATKTTDILMVQQQMYIEHKAGQMPGRGPGSNATADMRPYDPANPCANQPDVTCKKIGAETVSGRVCDHWEMTDKNGRISNIWVDQKLHFPIKITSDDSSILLSNIKEGEPDASLFQIPAGFHKMDMGGMMPPGMNRPPNN